MRIKNHSELQHVLAHLCLGLEALADDAPHLARHHVATIQETVFWGSDEEAEKDMACTTHKKPKPKKKKKGGKKRR